LINLLNNTDENTIVKFFENEIIIPILKVLKYKTNLPKHDYRYDYFYDNFKYQRKKLLNVILYYINLNIDLSHNKFIKYKKDLNAIIVEMKKWEDGPLVYYKPEPLFTIFSFIEKIITLPFNP
jgi:hypothetical protein